MLCYILQHFIKGVQYMLDITKYSIEEKVGQLFMVGFDGHEMNDDMYNLIINYNVSGVCYFSRNLHDKAQVRKLSDSLQKHTKYDFPLLLAIDQEGGRVNRITNDVITSPGNMPLGAIDNLLYTRRIAETVAHELKLMGINMNFAPSVDINNNPKNPVINTRSFGENIKKVTDMGLATIQGFEKHNVIPSVKHFPGHGDTAVDSHHDVPVIPHDLFRMDRVELTPFKKAIEHDVDSVMVSHLLFPALDPDNFATLSYPIVTELLREKLGFSGVVVTDCMEMDAIGKNYTMGEAAIKAIQAGIDLVLISHTYDKQRKAIDAVIQAVKAGVISEERINESFTRIMELKNRRKIEETIPFAWDEDWREEKKKFAKKLTDLSITKVKDSQQLLPIHKQENVVVLWPTIEKSSFAEEDFIQKDTLAYYLQNHSNHIQQFPLEHTPEIVNACEEADKIIIVTNNILRDEEQQIVVQALMHQFADKTIAISTHAPYDYAAYPEVSTYIAAYSANPTTLESLSRLLYGQLTNRARLPVTIDQQYKVGYRYKGK